jgi:hypothetical protein
MRANGAANRRLVTGPALKAGVLSIVPGADIRR